jgi:hypothetical protein
LRAKRSNLLPADVIANEVKQSLTAGLSSGKNEIDPTQASPRTARRTQKEKKTFVTFVPFVLKISSPIEHRTQADQ